ncbi:MAG: class A beta-lactamase-related serine hydrolase [Chloroflexota bacterium]|nr:class A beta-lactamase-related serine hydrolase [Chloroflexota bacterium]
MKPLVAGIVAIAFTSAVLLLSLSQMARASAATPTLTATVTRTPAPAPPLTPIPKPPPPPAPAPAIGPGIMVAQCLSTAPNSVQVTFLWAPSRSGNQWLDLSIYNNGFAPGTFITAGGFGPQLYGYIWPGLVQGTTHFARVNTLTTDGWKTSSTLAFYTPVCDGGASEPRPAADMVSLQGDIAAAISGTSINTAVAITDLRTGETIDIDGSQQRLPGCTINLFALMRVVVDVQSRKYAEPLVGDTIGMTINRSDPILARRLTRDFVGDGDLGTGMTRVNDFMHALGMTSTLMDHPPAFPEESLYGGIANRITARDVNRGLQALWGDRVLNAWWRDYLLYKMTLVKPGLNYLIPVGTSAGAIVSHKNGFLWEEGWADNDIGIVWFERDGERYGYAISFFTENVPAKYDDIPLGQEISSLAYQWFVSRYGYP